MRFRVSNRLDRCPLAALALAALCWPVPVPAPAPVAPRPKGATEDLQTLWKLAALGFQLAAVVGACLLIGYFVDRWLGTSPRWTSVGGIGGIVIGIVDFVRTAIRLNRQMNRSPRN